MRRRFLRACRAAFAPYRELYTVEAFADTAPGAEGVRARFASMRMFVALAEDGKVVGTIACSVHGADGHLRGMAVLPEVQGAGVAADLLRTAEDALRASRCKRVTLDSTEPLARAMRFYEREGYTRTGIVANFFGMPIHEFAKWLD